MSRERVNVTVDPFAVPNEEGSGGDTHFVGGYIPRHLGEYLNLWSTYFGQTKTRLLIDMLVEKSKRGNPSLATMLSTLADRAFAVWKQKLHLNYGKHEWETIEEVTSQFQKYVVLEVEEALRRRGIDEKSKGAIIESLKGRYEKEKDKDKILKRADQEKSK